MADVSPELLANIRNIFEKVCADDSGLEALRIGGDYASATHYAERLGKNLAQAFKFITPEALPDGRMYYNIAQKVVQPLLIDNWDSATASGAIAQDAINSAAGIGLKAIRPDVDTDRIDGILQRLADEMDFAKIQWILDDPVVNFSVHAIDKMVQENAQFQENSGLEVTFTRLDPGCCEWCAKLAGTFTYSNLPAHFWARHENCNCTIDYKPARGIGYRMRTSGKAFVKRYNIDKYNKANA